MEKYRFKFLVGLMSLALVGIILIQLYWIETTYDNNKRQFQYLVNHIIGKVAEHTKEKEQYDFHKKLLEYQTQTGKVPNNQEIKEFIYSEVDTRTNEKIVYSNIISFESLNDDLNFGTFIDSASGSKKDYKNYVSRRKMEIYQDRKSTRLNSSHVRISYAVFCLKKKKKKKKKKTKKKKKKSSKTKKDYTRNKN